ncbi:MAG TPA: hypothetical protein VFA09_23415 [Ktedonobacteraceae bacterium]|jgi:hypothetical protein|nr:hypothetical protein [Ktedonobacteraceae bacterium]
METNPYEYEQSIPWIPQQNQMFAKKDTTAMKEQTAWPLSPAQYRGQQQRVSAQRLQNVVAPLADARREGQSTLASARREGQAPVKGTRSTRQAPKEQRMTKARALELVRRFKQWLVVASIVSFGSISGLVAYHQVATTAATSNTSSTTSQSTSSSSSSSTNSSSSNNNTSSSSNSNSSTSSSGGYFNQHSSNNFGSSSSSSSVSGSSVS